MADTIKPITDDELAEIEAGLDGAESEAAPWVASVMPNAAAAMRSLIARIRAAEAERDRLREALSFYADVEDYKAPFTGGLGKLWTDCGETARAALGDA